MEQRRPSQRSRREGRLALVLLAEKDNYRRQRIAATTRAYLTQRPRNCRPRGRALENADAPRINNASTVDTAVGTRPTRQRLTLARLLFEQGDRHVTAEQLHGEAVEAAVRVSLATVYNTLHQFIEAGLLREVVVNSGRFYFDTNVSDHHHFFFEDTGQLLDIPGEYVTVCGLPKPPTGAAIRRIDMIIRVDRDPAPAAD